MSNKPTIEEVIEKWENRFNFTEGNSSEKALVRRAIIHELLSDLCNVREGWIKVGDYKDYTDGLPVIGFNELWIDEDFNPKGTRECYYRDINWVSAKFNPDIDEWEGVIESPTHVMLLPNPPKP
jgi:hypothetical protein